MPRSRTSQQLDASTPESSSPDGSSSSSSDEHPEATPEKELGVDIFQVAKATRTISGHFYSYKTGDTHYVRQIYPSLQALALAMYLEYHPLVQFYQRGDASRKCARRERTATPLGTPYPISYVWEETVEDHLPDYVRKLIDGRLLITDAGFATGQRTPRALALS